ncbi:hypothetical protein [Flavobacterium petrolei]|jgi:hypothetical protein|uniref:hypothetical protein n=1 Tax=Flavobacterium petrolei TaxID=2259594 RepID=UPI0037570B87
MSNITVGLLDNNLKRNTLKNLSLNKEHTKHQLSVSNLLDSDKKCYDFDKLNLNNNSVDGLEYKEETYYFIEFKDERVYNFEHNWAKTMGIISKIFQSINEILNLHIKNQVPKIEFYNKKLKFIIVFSSSKSTDFNDFKTLQTILTEKYGSIFNVDIVNETMFLTDYVDTNKIGIN